MSATLSEAPLNARELQVVIHARASDFQGVTVQATVTYRISDTAAAAGRLDLSAEHAHRGA